MTKHICPNCKAAVDLGDMVEAPFPVPEGCICNPHEWGDPDNIPPICGAWVDGDDPDLCGTCEHERECHR